MIAIVVAAIVCGLLALPMVIVTLAYIAQILVAFINDEDIPLEHFMRDLQAVTPWGLIAGARLHRVEAHKQAELADLEIEQKRLELEERRQRMTLQYWHDVNREEP